MKLGHNGDNFLFSSTGVQQGCPLAPLLFSLVLRELTTKISNTIPDLNLNMWYLDDGHLVGNSSSLLKCLELIKELGPPLGLHLNLSKCVVFGPKKATFPQEIGLATEGLIVLGAPVGDSNFVSKEVQVIVCKSASLISQSRDIQDPQMELLVLRCCTGSAKMLFWLRNCDPLIIKDQISYFDQQIDLALQHIFGVPI